MLKDFTIANLLDLNETIAKDLFEGKTYPWEHYWLEYLLKIRRIHLRRKSGRHMAF